MKTEVQMLIFVAFLGLGCIFLMGKALENEKWALELKEELSQCRNVAGKPI